MVDTMFSGLNGDEAASRLSGGLRRSTTEGSGGSAEANPPLKKCFDLGHLWAIAEGAEGFASKVVTGEYYFQEAGGKYFPYMGGGAENPPHPPLCLIPEPFPCSA